MLLTLLIPTLEKITNCALQRDPDALEKILSLKNQVIEINCVDWRVKFYMVIEQNELQFYQKYFGKINTTISGTLNNFLHIFIKGADTKTLFHYPIDISGNTHNIEVLRDIFKDLDIDFEERLSHFLGDTLAHKIMFHVKNTKKIVKKSIENLTDQTKEYIHCEARNLVSKKQVEKFYSDIAKLRDDAERMEARLREV